MDISDQYQVEFTDECKREIRKIYNYIKEDLYAEQAAQNLMLKVEEYTSNLSSTVTAKMFSPSVKILAAVVESLFEIHLTVVHSRFCM